MAIVNTILFQGSRDLVVRCIKTDGGAETDAIVVDKSTLVGPDGTEPSELIVDRLEWSVTASGAGGVLLEWDLTTDEAFATLSDRFGHLDWTSFGGVSPQSGGETGDIVLTVAALALASFTITLWLRKKD